MMKTFNLKSKISADGVLRITIPTKLKEKEVDVLIVYDVQDDSKEAGKVRWPEKFFSDTYGCLSSDPIERPFQGEYPIREKIL